MFSQAWQRGVFATLLLLLVRPAAPLPAQEKGSEQALPVPDVPWSGDFDGMRERRLIRVLVVYNRTIYFVDKGTPRGIMAEAFKMFEDFINRKYRTKKLPIHVVLIPVHRDALAEMLLAGKGDIAAAYITVRPELLERLDFSNPTAKNVSEIVVSGPASLPLRLRGRPVWPAGLCPKGLWLQREPGQAKCRPRQAG